MTSKIDGTVAHTTALFLQPERVAKKPNVCVDYVYRPLNEEISTFRCRIARELAEYVTHGWKYTVVAPTEGQISDFGPTWLHCRRGGELSAVGARFSNI